MRLQVNYLFVNLYGLNLRQKIIKKIYTHLCTQSNVHYIVVNRITLDTSLFLISHDFKTGFFKSETIGQNIIAYLVKYFLYCDVSRPTSSPFARTFFRSTCFYPSPLTFKYVKHNSWFQLCSSTHSCVVPVVFEILFQLEKQIYELLGNPKK